MTKKSILHLGNIQNTLFLPLWGRAVETQKSKPLLIDNKAAEIYQAVKDEIILSTEKISPLSQIAWVMRSVYTDLVCHKFLAYRPEGIIVNIGCGLDTTFERVDNGFLHWIDLDLPDVVEVRKRFFSDNKRRKTIASSFLDVDWLANIPTKENILFIAAGVFYYFEEFEIKSFLIRLADLFSESQILFDVSSPIGVKIANKKVIENSGLDNASYLKWGLKNTKDLISWDERFKLINTYFYFRNNCFPLNIRLLGWLSDWLQIQYMIHLQL